MGAAKPIIVGAAALLIAWSGWSHAQTSSAPTQTAPTPQDRAAPGAASAPTGDALDDLDAMTFDCAKAGLNAAAREAAKAPSEGRYQFSFFRIISDSHHAAYEVHFKSNHDGEPELRYCVAIYCQQGWDPRTAETSVSRMGDDRGRGTGTHHAAACKTPGRPATPRTKR